MEPIEVAGYLLGQRTKGYTAHYVHHDERGRRTGRIVLWDRRTWLLAEDDGYVMFSGPEGSEIRVGKGRYQRGPAIPLGLTDNPAAFLRPRHAPIWGRPQHDWRLAGPVQVEGNTATLRLVHASDPTLEGSVTADLEYCAILDLQVPGRRTTLTCIEHTVSAADQRLLQRVDPGR